MEPTLIDAAAQVWPELKESLGALDLSGPRVVLSSPFDVTGLAVASVAAATLAAAEFDAVRSGRRLRRVRVDSRDACAAFAGEALFTPIGWERPGIWDALSGNYRTADGWIRLHTNYAYHRRAVESVLGVTDPTDAADVVDAWAGDALESAVVAAGGCAAVMHDRDEWLTTPHGRATAEEPAIIRTTLGAAAVTPDPSPRPFDGVKVLDLTRVIAGPVCTKFLAAFGADVLRVDPPGFQEVPALLPETTAGKRTAALDLTRAGDRAVFESLVERADVLVSGLRAGALDGLGYGVPALAARNPRLIVANLNAYGWHGPWLQRRGFDSLTQMSCGIAAGDRPAPLPVQALDHATGYLLAAAVGQALSRRVTTGAVDRIQASLIGTANLLWSLPVADLPATGPDVTLVGTTTAWGPARRVALPGHIAGVADDWRIPAGPLGRHLAVWS